MAYRIEAETILDIGEVILKVLLIKTLEENMDVFLAASTLFTRIYEPILTSSTTRPPRHSLALCRGLGDEGGDFVFIKKD